MERHILLETGRLTLDLDTRLALFLARPHEAYEAHGVTTFVCAALAG